VLLFLQEEYFETVYLIIFNDFVSFVIKWSSHNLVYDEKKIKIGDKEEMNKESVNFQI